MGGQFKESSLTEAKRARAIAYLKNLSGGHSTIDG